MLKNTAFHDNLYQLAKIITITSEGLSLELSENMFLDKVISDISFISDTLQTLFIEVQNLIYLNICRLCSVSIRAKRIIYCS